MKKFIATFCLIISIVQVYAQSPIEVGQKQLNAGFGFSNYGLPVYVGLDYCFMDDVTLGGEFSYRSYNDEFFGAKYNHKLIGFLVNGNYHFNTLLDIPSEYDIYGGLNIGFYTLSSPDGYPGNKNSGLGLGLQIGARYYFNDSFGVNLELTGGNNLTGRSGASGGKIGVSVKF